MLELSGVLFEKHATPSSLSTRPALSLAELADNVHGSVSPTSDSALIISSVAMSNAKRRLEIYVAQLDKADEAKDAILQSLKAWRNWRRQINPSSR